MRHTPGRDSGSGGRESPAEGARLAATIVEILRERGETLALAESCTGGLIAAAVTVVPGSSECLWGGAVVYSADAKESMLGIESWFLDRHGPVSAETTKMLACRVRLSSGATFGLAVTGWAGPTGGSDADPVGTVYVALSSARGESVRRHLFAGDRADVREQAAVAALGRLQEDLTGASRLGGRASSDPERSGG